MKQRFYRLNDNKEVESCTFDEWGDFHTLIVKQEEVGERWVSTVFVGINYNLGWGEEKRPTVFETMVFSDDNDPANGYREHHCTYKEALGAHEAIVNRLKTGWVNE